MRALLLFLFLGCAKSPCIVAVDVAFKNTETGISAAASKKIKCGDYITFPFHDNVATKLPAFIEVNFFQGSRVVLADVVFNIDFVDGIYQREYEFTDTNPDLMIWKVYDVDRTGWVQYETVIK